MSRCAERGVRGFRRGVELPEEPCHREALPGSRFCPQHGLCPTCQSHDPDPHATWCEERT